MRKSRSQGGAAKRTAANTVRIIAGKWRSRRIIVPPGDGLRPTGDRARETLFNWLTPYLPGANVLDLFAGSGVLSFEALSRGADRATLIEKNPTAASQLKDTGAAFEHPGVNVICAEALEWLTKGSATRFDIIFLDPPFDSDLMSTALSSICPNWLTSTGLVYVETSHELGDITLPGGLQWTKSTRLGNVCIGLASQLAEN